MKFEQLTVFVSDHCPTCVDAVSIARSVQNRYPDLEVEIFDIDHEKPRSEVFAIPTYMIDDRIAFLGNPTDEDIERLLGKPTTETAIRSTDPFETPTPSPVRP